MKRIIAAALLMMLLCAGALAQEKALYTYDFGDFTIDLEEGVFGAANEKADGGVRLVVMPGYQEGDSFHDSLNLVWQNIYIDMREADLDEFTKTSREQIIEQMEHDGVKLHEIELLEADRVKLDGMRGMYYLISAEHEYTHENDSIHTTLYSQTSMFSDEYLGTYIFTLTAESMDMIEQMRSILETIRWD